MTGQGDKIATTRSWCFVVRHFRDSYMFGLSVRRQVRFNIYVLVKRRDRSISGLAPFAYLPKNVKSGLCACMYACYATHIYAYVYSYFGRSWVLRPAAENRAGV